MNIRKWEQGKPLQPPTILSPEVTKAVALIESCHLYEGNGDERRLVARFEKPDDAKLAVLSPQLLHHAKKLVKAVRMSGYPFRLQGQVMDSVRDLEKLWEGLCQK